MRKMKLNVIRAAVVGTTILLAMPAFAALITGGEGRVEDAGDGPGIDVKFSPGVDFGYTLVASGNSFAINSENTNIQFKDDGSIENRNEYGIASDYNGYYQRAVVAANIAVPTQPDSTAFNTDYRKF